MTGEDVASACMRWLEQDLDRDDPDVAALAGVSGLTRSDVQAPFERALRTVMDGPLERDDAILLALRLHLAAALEGDLMTNVQLLLDRFHGLSERRLVVHPRRSKHHPDRDYAAQSLGLEYVYGAFLAFDDLWRASGRKQEAWRNEMHADLRLAVSELNDHLTLLLAEPA